MKKIMFTAIMLMMPIFVNANQIFLSCPTEIEKNAEFTCTVTGKSSSVITSISASVTLGDKLQFLSFTSDDKWQGNATNGVIDVYTSDTITGSFKIGTLKLKNTGEGNNSVTLETVKFHDDNYKKIDVSSVRKDVLLKVNNVVNENKNNNINNNNNQNNNNTNNGSNQGTGNDDVLDNDNQISSEDNEIIDNNYLENILIDGYNINFDKDRYEYTLIIKNEEKLDIETKTIGDNITVTVNGNQNLVNGSVIEINVLTDDNKLDVYSIKIVKETENDVKKNNNYGIIFIVIIGVLVFVNIIRLILNRRRRNDG